MQEQEQRKINYFSIIFNFEAKKRAKKIPERLVTCPGWGENDLFF